MDFWCGITVSIGQRIGCIIYHIAIAPIFIYYGLQCPFSDIALFNGIVHGKVSVPVRLSTEAILDGYLYYLFGYPRTALPVHSVRFRIGWLFADHTDHCLETLSVIQPAQYKRCGKDNAMSFGFASKKGFDFVPKGRWSSVWWIILFPLLLECFNNLFRDGFFTEQQAYVVKIFHTVIAPAQFPFRLDLGQLFENGTADSEIMPLVPVCHQTREAVVFFPVAVLPLENVSLELVVYQSGFRHSVICK